MYKKKVLLVDDEVGFTSITKLSLEDTGEFEVRIENEGKRGIGAALDFKPDLILLDIIMPDMDGAEVVSVLQKEFPDIKMIVMTGGIGRPEDYLKGDATSSKLIQTLNKPFPRDELLQVVKEAVG